jgi:hypothetical protein
MGALNDDEAVEAYCRALDASQRKQVVDGDRVEAFLKGRGSAAAVRLTAVGCGLPCSLGRVLARARQRVLGRHLGGPCLPAASRCVAPQGLVPHDRHWHWRHGDRGADRVLPPGSRRLSRESGTVGRRVRARRDALAQLRGICRISRRLHRCGRRERPARCDRGSERAGFPARGYPRQRDLHRHSLRRHRARRDRPRRSPAAAGRPVRRHHRTVYRDLVAGRAGPAGNEPVRRELIRRVTALEPVIDETIGESSRLRYHSPVLQRDFEHAGS